MTRLIHLQTNSPVTRRAEAAEHQGGHDRHRHKSKKRRHKHKKKYKRKRSNKSRDCDSESEESVNGTGNEEFDNSMRHRKYRKVDA